jgi:hypothetical protein
MKAKQQARDWRRCCRMVLAAIKALPRLAPYKVKGKGK